MFWKLATAPRIPVITAEEVRTRLEAGEKPVIIDVREPHEYARGHIPGAKLIPLRTLSQRLHELDSSREIILVCRSGQRSGVACQLMAKQGFTGATNMTGGMLSWRGPVK